MSTDALTGIPDLWPDEIKQVSLTPIAILRAQAGKLREKTRNLLEAEITTDRSPDGRVLHTFLVVAPAMDRYRYRLVEVDHDETLVYPARVYASELENDYGDEAGIAAFNDVGFMKLIARVFKGSRTTSVISSLVAQSNERGRPS